MPKGSQQLTTAYIGLGSNLGDRGGFINRALNELDGIGGVNVDAMTKQVQTAPLDAKDQPDYINAVARIHTRLSPERLFERMAAIEDSLGRVRSGERWDSRTIDLDLLLYGDEVVDQPDLIVPHSQMHLRSFVLTGICELDGDLVHPILKRTMSELAKRLGGNDFVIDPSRPQLISVAGMIGVGKTTLAANLAEKLSCDMLAEAYDSNPFIAKVYAGKEDLALDSQMFFLNSRLEQLGPGTLTPAEPVVSDYVFDKEMIYARRTLDPMQLAEYGTSHHRVADRVAEPVLVIYLSDSPQACLERIHKRNRPYEQQIELSTLENFAGDYDRLFEHWPKSPLITLDAAEFNCLDDGHMQILADEVKSYICS
jgi:2-amino-4-hydroxy-6-hydroxymethyldihydropteridine diphosphokinase